jgi:hypothetical protein
MDIVIYNRDQLLMTLEQARDKVRNRNLQEIIFDHEWLDMFRDIMCAFMTWTAHVGCGVAWGKGLTLHVSVYDPDLHLHPFYDQAWVEDELNLQEDAVAFQRQSFVNFINSLINFFLK